MLMLGPILHGGEGGPPLGVPPVPPFSAFTPRLYASNSSKHSALAVHLQGTKHVPIMTSQIGDHESPQTSATSKADLKSSTQRVPPPETPEAIQTRFRVIAAFWAVIIFLGFPIWWKTTSIYRAHLPIQDMADWADGKVGHCLWKEEGMRPLKEPST